MSGFNEANTIEEAIRDRLAALPSEKWTFVHGPDLPREAQEVLIESWLKDALCRLNPDIAKDSEKADEVIYKLRGVLLEASHSGLVRANELFTEWLRGEKSMPLGKDGEHITINLVDYNDHSKNHYVVSQQVPSMGAKNAFFDLVFRWWLGKSKHLSACPSAGKMVPQILWVATSITGPIRAVFLCLIFCASQQKERALHMAR